MFMNAEGIISWDEYAVCLGVIDAKLRKDGMRDKLKFIGSSNAGNVPKNFKVEQEKTKQYYDILGTGNYNWDNDAPMESAENYFTEMIGISKEFGKKGWYVAEFCQGKHFINAVDKEDIDWYTAGLYVARFATAATSVGATAFNHYILGDTRFNNKSYHTMGLWMYRDNGWKAHPEFYFYAMVCRYSDIGSKIYPIVQADKYNPQYDINMVALKLPDGSWTYFICNNSDDVKKWAL